MEELIGLLKGELDKFMATHASTVLSTMEDDSVDATCQSEVNRIGKMWTIMAKRNFGLAVHTLLDWQTVRLDGSLIGHVGVWLTGKILNMVLENQVDANGKLEDSVAASAVEATFKILREWNHVECTTESDSPFFAFKGLSMKPTHDFFLQKSVHFVWRDNLGYLGIYAIRHIKAQALKDLESAAGVSKEYVLNNYSGLRLNLIKPNSTYDEQAQETTSFLRVLASCTHKAENMTVRLNALQVLGSIFTQELSQLSKYGMRAYNDVKEGTDLSNLLGDLHVAAWKLSTKKRYTVVAWHVRIAALMLSNEAYFSSHWKDDADSLLEDFGKHKGSVPFLHLIEFLLHHLVQRHLATKRQIPSDKQMMEVINSIQAWCFTNSKHKMKKMRVIFSVLTKMTLCLAAYNVDYAIQSHVQRLLMESESIFEVRQLVGLLSLRALFQQTGMLPTSEPIYIKINETAVRSKCSSLGESLSQVLNTCSKNLDVPGKTTKTTEFNQWIGLLSFEAAIACTSCIFESVALNVDYTLSILTHSAVHHDKSLQTTAAETLRHIGVERVDYAVFRSIGLHLLGVDNAWDAPLLLQIVETIVRDPKLSIQGPLDEELATLEALALYLLCNNGSDIRLKSLSVLEAVRYLRQTRLQSIKISIMDIVTGIDGDLYKQLHLQESERQKAIEMGGIMKWLASNSTGSEWPWSLCLATLFPRVSDVCQDLIAQVWTCALNALYQLETGVPDDGRAIDGETLSRWRNLAILACSTGYISSAEATTTLLNRLSRYLKSPVIDQQISVAVALSTTHFSSHLVLLNVLSDISSTVFVPESANGYKRHSELHGAVVGSLARCYRSIVEHRVHLWMNEQFRSHVLDFIEKLMKAIIMGDSIPPNWLWWSRCEFCAIVESVIHQNNLACLVDDNENNFIDVNTRERWFKAAFAWCERSIEITKTPFTAASALLPLSRDHGALWHRYTLTRAAYSVMSVLLIGPVFDPVICFTWIDDGFSQKNASELQELASNGLKVLLQSDPCPNLPKAIERCYYMDKPGNSTHYLQVLSSLVVDLRDEMQNCPNFCDLLFVSILHLAQQNNESSLQILSTMLLHEDPLDQPFLTIPSSRQIHFVSTQIASRWKSKSLQMVQLMISFIAKCNNAGLQSHILSHTSVWVHEMEAIDRSFLTLFFRATHENPSLGSFSSLWLDFSRSNQYKHLDCILEFFTGLPTKEKLQTARKILTWITPLQEDTKQVLRRLLNHMQNANTFAASALAMILLAGLATLLDEKLYIILAHRAFSILYLNANHPNDCDDMFLGVEDDCLVILEAMIHKDTIGYKSLLQVLHDYSSQFDILLERYCLSLSKEQQKEWAQKSSSAFSMSHFDAKFSLKLYRFLQPTFDGHVYVNLMGLLKEALDNVNGSEFVEEYLMALTSITKTMPPSKLVLYPQLVWAIIALLQNEVNPAIVFPALSLLGELVCKSTFLDPIVQDVYTARRPQQMKAKDILTDILQVVSRHMTTTENEKIVRKIAIQVVGSKSSTKLQCVLCTAILLPTLSSSNIDAKESWSIRQDLSFLWRRQNQQNIASIILQDNIVPWTMSSALGRLFMSMVTTTEEEKAFFDVFLTILNGQCTDLIPPTLGLLHALIQIPPPMFWKRNATLLTALTRILQSTSSNDPTWPTLVSLLSTLLPSP